ncbi:MAG: hypothetical protein U5K31_04105 [Balneolaceae bacterium]|nr:hypothetical protein [Balneolaceae bacterium]
MAHPSSSLNKILLGLFTIAFLLPALQGNVRAQDNGTTVHDSGLDNLQTVTRSPGELSALAYIVQVGSGGSATIIQQAGASAAGAAFGEAHIRQLDGWGNEALIHQESATGPHDHEVVQRGDRNTATLRARAGGQQGTVIQEGTSNTVRLEQYGAAGSRAYVRQGRSEPGGDVSGNLIEIYQGMGGDHTLRVIQTGSHNSGDIIQYGTGADAFLHQAGDRNNARILQGSSPQRGGHQR